MAIQHAFPRRETTPAEVDFKIAEKIGRHRGTPPSDPALERKRAGRFPSVLERVLSSTENQTVVLERFLEQGRIP